MITGSTGIPVFGNYFEYKRDRLRFLKKLRQDYGDLSSFKMGPTQVILVTHPDDVQWVLQKHAKNYSKATNLSLVLGQGILTSEHDLWRKQRKLIQPLFHQHHIFSLIPLMNQKVQSTLDDIENAFRKNPQIKISDTMMRLAYEVVGEALFGSNLTAHFERLHRTMIYLNQFITQKLYQMVPLPLSFPIPSHLKFKKAKGDLDRLIYQLIDEKTEELKSGNAKIDLVSNLLQVRDEETQEGMNREQIRDEAVTLLLAGHETTGHTLTWILFILSKYPEVQRKVIEEVDEVLKGRTPTSAELTSFPYLSSVIDETLRVYPPVWAWTRKAIEADRLRENVIPAGSILFLCPYLTHRHPDFWNNPDTFNPANFLSDTSDKNKGAYFPFGLGPRQCIGKHFALMEVKLVLTQFLQRFEVETNPSREAIPQPQITMGILDGLTVKLKRRRWQRQ